MKKTFLMTIAAAAIFTACEKDEINSLNSDLMDANGRIEQIATQANAALESAKLELEAAIVAGDEVAEAAAAEALAAYIVSQADINDDIQAQLDALEGVSASYDAETGIVAITLANGTIFETGDLRGEDGEDGRDGRDGADGADGINGTNGTDGQDGADGADGQDGIGGGGEPGLSQEAIQALIDKAIADLASDADIATLQAAITALELSVADTTDADAIIALEVEIEKLKARISLLENPGDEPDAIIFGEWVDGDITVPSADITSGSVSITLTVAGSDVEFVTQTTTTEQFSQVPAYSYGQTRSYTVSQVGIALDDPAPKPAASELVNTVDVPAGAKTKIADKVEINNSFPNPAYVPADPADTLSDWSEFVGADPGYGASLTRTENVIEATFADNSVQFGTKTWNLVTYQAAYTYEQTRTRTVIQNGDLDSTPPAGALTETKTVSVGENVISTDPQSEQVTNPNYDDGGDAVSVDASVTYIANSFFGGLATYTVNGVESATSVAGVSAGDTITVVITKPGSAVKTVVITVDAADLEDEVYVITINADNLSASGN